MFGLGFVRSGTGRADGGVFKRPLENVVAEGLFDRNWKAPAEAAAKMRETGTVVIQ